MTFQHWLAKQAEEETEAGALARALARNDLDLAQPATRAALSQALRTYEAEKVSGTSDGTRGEQGPPGGLEIVGGGAAHPGAPAEMRRP